MGLVTHDFLDAKACQISYPTLPQGYRQNNHGDGGADCYPVPMDVAPKHRVHDDGHQYGYSYQRQRS